MKIPKQIKKYCPYCKTVTTVKVVITKRKKASAMKHGNKYRARLRGKARGHGNLGRYSKRPITKWKKTGSKQTKKTDIKFVCTKCGKAFNQSSGIRAKKVELI
ncbi:MAG: 50S ribosomal protein L44e [Nitrospiraceae bacterium]|nr:50S ribosomal protein L44e [Nitrospiraceae bacterium]